MQENKRDISILKLRILEYLEFKGVSKSECYQKTGISRSVLSQANGMTEDNLLKFLAQYNDISLEWLIIGKGEMIKKEEEKGPILNESKMIERQLIFIESQQQTIKSQQQTIEILSKKVGGDIAEGA